MFMVRSADFRTFLLWRSKAFVGLVLSKREFLNLAEMGCSSAAPLHKLA
jgi:hypothetical protein